MTNTLAMARGLGVEYNPFPMSHARMQSVGGFGFDFGLGNILNTLINTGLNVGVTVGTAELGNLLGGTSNPVTSNPTIKPIIQPVIQPVIPGQVSPGTVQTLGNTGTTQTGTVQPTLANSLSPYLPYIIGGVGLIALVVLLKKK